MVREKMFDAPPSRSEGKNYCSEASAQQIFKHFGIRKSQHDIHSRAWTIEEMLPLFSEHGIRVETRKFRSIPQIRKLILQYDAPLILRYPYTTGGGHTVTVMGFGPGEEIHIIDPDRGEMSWSRKDIPPNTVIYTFEKESQPDAPLENDSMTELDIVCAKCGHALRALSKQCPACNNELFLIDEKTDTTKDFLVGKTGFKPGQIVKHTCGHRGEIITVVGSRLKVYDYTEGKEVAWFTDEVVLQ